METRKSIYITNPTVLNFLKSFSNFSEFMSIEIEKRCPDILDEKIAEHKAAMEKYQFIKDTLYAQINLILKNATQREITSLREAKQDIMKNQGFFGPRLKAYNYEFGRNLMRWQFVKLLEGIENEGKGNND